VENSLGYRPSLADLVIIQLSIIPLTKDQLKTKRSCHKKARFMEVNLFHQIMNFRTLRFSSINILICLSDMEVNLVAICCKANRVAICCKARSLMA